MFGLLADENLQGHLPYLRHLFESLDLWGVLSVLSIQLATFPDIKLSRGTDDRTLWNRCQKDGWVLFTENRNQDGPDSLQATLLDSWKVGLLPVLTLSNKNRFEHSRAYAERVAKDIAELLFGIVHGEYHDQSRIFVPYF